MKKIYLIALIFAFTGAGIMTSCTKDQLVELAAEATKPNTVDTTGGDGKSNILVVNVLAGNEGTSLDLLVNGNSLVEDLGLKEATNYISLDNGKATLQAVSADGKVLASSEFVFNKQEFYNIIITRGADGVSPEIKVLDMEPLAFVNDGSFADLLNADAVPTELFGINVLDLTNDLPSDNLLIGMEYLNGANELVPAVMELDKGVLSGVVFGNQDLLKGLDVLNSSVPLETLLADLQKQNPGLDMENLGGATALEGLPDSKNLLALLGQAPSVLTDLLGGNTNSLVVLYDALFGEAVMKPAHHYTMVLFGDENNPQYKLIDQTLAGLPSVP